MRQLWQQCPQPARVVTQRKGTSECGRSSASQDMMETQKPRGSLLSVKGLGPPPSPAGDTGLQQGNAILRQGFHRVEYGWGTHSSSPGKKMVGLRAGIWA